MKLIVGLGNPENKFQLTKHNFGFWILDKLVEQRSLKYKVGKGDYLLAKDGENIFLKPTTYVNNSGIAVKQLMNYYDNISINDIIIIYDDIDLILGNIKFRPSGLDGGHNGIKSIIYHLQSDIWDRLKIGIATTENMRPSEKYVLKSFPKKYKELVNIVIEEATMGIDYYLQCGINRSMNKYNKRKNNG